MGAMTVVGTTTGTDEATLVEEAEETRTGTEETTEEVNLVVETRTGTEESTEELSLVERTRRVVFVTALVVDTRVVVPLLVTALVVERAGAVPVLLVTALVVETTGMELAMEVTVQGQLFFCSQLPTHLSERG